MPPGPAPLIRCMYMSDMLGGVPGTKIYTKLPQNLVYLRNEPRIKHIEILAIYHYLVFFLRERSHVRTFVHAKCI